MNHIVCFDMAQLMGSERVGRRWFSDMGGHLRRSTELTRSGDWADDLG